MGVDNIGVVSSVVMVSFITLFYASMLFLDCLLDVGPYVIS